MPSMPLPDLVILTGVDAKFFWQFFLLSESIRRASPRTRLLVCDFGLTPAQQRFFRDKDILLDMPADAGVHPHAWYYKAMLGSYISAPAVFWVDVDMIILDDIGALAARLCTEMERDDHMLAASCDPAGGIGAWLAQNQAPGFAARAVKLDPSLPYLSSGIFLCRSAAFLTQWQAECIAMPYEMLFEQNAFNLAAWTAPDAVTPRATCMESVRAGYWPDAMPVARECALYTDCVGHGACSPCHID